MNTTRKSILAAALTLTVSILSAASALASAWPGTDIKDLSTFLSNAGVTATTYTADLSGSYYVTPLGYEAGDTIRLQYSDNNILFTNKNLATEFGTVKLANLGTGAGNAYFNDVTTNPNTTFGANDSRVTVMQLTSVWTLSNGMKLDIGTLILGLNDKGSADCDSDDFILAASRTAPTPIPGAVWLLGSGLLGVMGFKRTRKTEKA